MEIHINLFCFLFNFTQNKICHLDVSDGSNNIPVLINSLKEKYNFNIHLEDSNGGYLFLTPENNLKVIK